MVFEYFAEGAKIEQNPESDSTMAFINHSIFPAMKTAILLPALSLIILGSCSSYRTGSVEPDDRYYSLADARKEQRQLKKLREEADQPAENNTQNPTYKQYQDQTPPAEQGSAYGNQTIVNNYYDMDDYYDYMYASRIRRFYSPYNSFSYYSPYYTNMYWYNYDPFYFGTSIYNSYSFFNPYVPWGYNSYKPGWSFGWNSWSGLYLQYNWGWYNPWNYYGFGPHYSPFLYNPWACNPFGMGYWHHHHPYGYNMSLLQQSYTYNQMYFNSYDQNTYVPPVVNKPSSGGFGAGANMIKTAPSLTQTLSNEFGSAPFTQTKPVSGKTSGSGKTLQSTSPAISGGNSLQNNLKSGQTKTPGDQPAMQINTQSGSNTLAKPKTDADKYTSVKQASQNQAVSPSVNQNQSANQDKNLQSIQANPQNQSSGNQIGKDGLIKSGLPMNTNGNYNSVPSSGTNRNQQNIYQRIPDMQNSQEIQQNNTGQTPINSSGQINSKGGQPYKPSYDYNRTLPGNSTEQPVMQRQSPPVPTQIERKQEIRQNPGKQERQSPSYQQNSEPRQNNRIMYSPQNSTPTDRAPSRQNSIRQQQEQPVFRQERNDVNRSMRYQSPQRSEPQFREAPSANPGRSIENRPSNSNMGGNRGQGGGNHLNRNNSIRR